MNLKVLKCHGSGNDFFLIDIRKLEDFFNDNIKANLSIKLCDRQKGIGADGILYITNSETSDCQMRIFNSDGSEAEMCGNGIRIVGRYISELKNKTTVVVENLTGLKYTIENSPNFYEGIIAYKVKLPPTVFKSKQIPIITDLEEFNNVQVKELSETLRFSGLGMPNPHIISFVDHINIDDLKYLGLKANQYKKLFPNGMNVSLVKLIDKNILYTATYERGVGFTYSCGTAMCASAITSVKNNLLEFDTDIKVLNKGGFIYVNVAKDWSCYMTGNATYDFEANIEFDSLFKDSIEFQKGKSFIDEASAYNSLLKSLE